MTLISYIAKHFAITSSRTEKLLNRTEEYKTIGEADGCFRKDDNSGEGVISCANLLVRTYYSDLISQNFLN